MRKYVTRAEYIDALNVVVAYRSQCKGDYLGITEMERVRAINREVAQLAIEFDLMVKKQNRTRSIPRFIILTWLKKNTTFTGTTMVQMVGVTNHTAANYAIKMDYILDKNPQYNQYSEMILPRLKRYEKGVFELDSPTEG